MSYKRKHENLGLHHSREESFQFRSFSRSTNPLSRAFRLHALHYVNLVDKIRNHILYCDFFVSLTRVYM